MAPGVNILSTYSCEAAGDCGSYWYAYMSGTSMSAPHVAATVALILEKHPNYTVNEVKEALYETALDLGASGWDELYGWGRVDALAAVNYEGAAPPPPSPPPPPPTDCGDGVCAGIAEGEDCFICPADCRCTGKNCSRSCCGDGKCLNETIKNCPIDCAL